jgi:hypothetical protein
MPNSQVLSVKDFRITDYQHGTVTMIAAVMPDFGFPTPLINLQITVIFNVGRFKPLTFFTEMP